MTLIDSRRLRSVECRPIDHDAAEKISEIFIEVIVAPGFPDPVMEFLRKKKDRRLIRTAADLRVLVQDNLRFERGFDSLEHRLLGTFPRPKRRHARRDDPRRLRGIGAIVEQRTDQQGGSSLARKEEGPDVFDVGVFSLELLEIHVLLDPFGNHRFGGTRDAGMLIWLDRGRSARRCNDASACVARRRPTHAGDGRHAAGWRHALRVYALR